MHRPQSSTGGMSIRSSEALSFRSSEADKTGARAYLFRPDTRAGLKEVMEYFRIRDMYKDPWKWPERPALHLVGFKNLIKRLRTDLETYMEWSGHSTTRHTFLLDESLDELQRFLVSSPPKHYHTNLSGDIISAYLCLHRRGALQQWPETSKTLEFYCTQVRDSITTKRMITHFEEHAHSATTRESVNMMTELETRPDGHLVDIRAESPPARQTWWKFKRKGAT